MNNKQEEVAMKSNKVEVLGMVELEVNRINQLNKDQIDVTEKPIEVPRRGDLTMGITKRMDSLQKSAGKREERRVVVAGRGSTKKKRMEGAMVVKRIDDFFDNNFQGGSKNDNKRKVEGSAVDGARNVKRK